MRQTPWREDPDILRRMSMVEVCWQRGMTIPDTLTVVNKAETERSVQMGYEPKLVSREAIKDDRKRIKELWLEAVQRGIEGHIQSMEFTRQRIWASIEALPLAHPNRATLYALAIRITESVAKMDGSWGPGARLDIHHHQDSDPLPTPIEMLRQGTISEEAYDNYLRVIESMTKTEPHAPRIIDVSPQEPRMNGNEPLEKAIPGIPNPMGAVDLLVRGEQVDEEPGEEGVVEWRPEDEE